MQTIQKITPVCQVEKKKKAKKYLYYSWKEFLEILIRIDSGELKLPSLSLSEQHSAIEATEVAFKAVDYQGKSRLNDSLAKDIECALKQTLFAKYGITLVTDKQKADAKYAARQGLLDKVRALKLKHFIKNENRFPSEAEIADYQRYSYEAPLSPLCEQKAVFYNVLTKKKIPFTCHRLRCGCLKCAAAAMENREVKVSSMIFKYPALCRMITLTLDIKKIPGDTLDQKREYAWNCMIGECRAEFIRLLRKYFKKRGVNLEKDFHYIWWTEPHKEPASCQFPHVHMIIDEYIDKEIVNEFAKKSGLGIPHIEMWSDNSKAGKYASKKVRNSIAKYTSKSVVDSADDVDDDEKCFDRRALLYILPRKRLIGFSRNLTKGSPENTGLSAWSIVEGKSDNLLASELVENVDSKEYPIYHSAHTNTIIGLWNYIAGGSVKVKPSVAKIVEKARESNDKTILLNLAKELAHCGYLVSIDKMEIINDSPAIREINIVLKKPSVAKMIEKASESSDKTILRNLASELARCGCQATPDLTAALTIASDKYLQFRPNMDD